MIDLSVSEGLSAQIDDESSARSIFESLQGIFHFPSRTTHLGLWQEETALRSERGGSVGDHLTKIKGKVEELDRTGFEWSKDSILGVLMQLSLPTAGDHSFNNVNVTLEARLKTAPDQQISA